MQKYHTAERSLPASCSTLVSSIRQTAIVNNRFWASQSVYDRGDGCTWFTTALTVPRHRLSTYGHDLIVVTESIVSMCLSCLVFEIQSQDA